MIRPHPIERAIAIAAWLALVVAAASCGPSSRETALRSTLVTLDAAGAGLASWDRQHQQQLVDANPTPEARRAAIASYRTEREPALAALEVAYKALAHAAVLSDDPSMSAALAAVVDLKTAIEHLGATWPTEQP